MNMQWQEWISYEYEVVGTTEEWLSYEYAVVGMDVL